MNFFDPPYELYDEEKEIFGKHLINPNIQIPHGKETLIAKYPKRPKGDGLHVDIFTVAMPAKFYIIKARTGKDSCGDTKYGFSLNTGSGTEMAKLANELALAIADGMLGITEE